MSYISSHKLEKGSKNVWAHTAQTCELEQNKKKIKIISADLHFTMNWENISYLIIKFLIIYIHLQAFVY